MWLGAARQRFESSQIELFCVVLRGGECDACLPLGMSDEKQYIPGTYIYIMHMFYRLAFCFFNIPRTPPAKLERSEKIQVKKMVV